jgi:hypothetical protein
VENKKEKTMNHSRNVRRLFGIVPLAMLLVSACQPITAPTSVESGAEMAATTNAAAHNAIEFEAIDVECPDGHLVLSDSPFVAGASTVEGSQAADAQDFTMSATFFPSAYEGSTWAAPGWGLDAPDGSFEVFHSGEGTGQLAGSRIIFHVSPIADVENLPCEPSGPVVRLEGVIVSDLLDAPQVSAREFVDYDISCPDGNVIISDEPLSIGRSEVEVIPDPDHNYLTVNVTVFPDAYPESTWIVPGHGVGTSDGGFLVIHRGSGTGELQNGKALYIATPADDLEDLPCEPDGPVVKSEGVYILRDK